MADMTPRSLPQSHRLGRQRSNARADNLGRQRRHLTHLRSARRLDSETGAGSRDNADSRPLRSPPEGSSSARSLTRPGLL
eukprot:2136014-Rhodomonas_salina.2